MDFTNTYDGIFWEELNDEQQRYVHSGFMYNSGIDALADIS